MSYSQHTTPKNLLIFYGWPSCFNSAVNGWDVNKVAEDMSRYDVIVLGAGLQDPTHGDHINTVAVISKIKTLKPSVSIFGYVTILQTYASFRTQVLAWDAMNVSGIFCDEAGYDFGTVATNGRVAFNEKLGLLHACKLLAFVNAWNPDHVLGVVNDSTFPNSIYNPDNIPSLVRKVDWYLFESLAVNDSAYSGDLEPQAQYMARMVKASRYTERVQMASVGIIDVVNPAKFNFLWVAGVMGGMDAVGSADSLYGASSATTHWYERPQDWPWGNYYESSPIVQSLVDITVLLRFLVGGNVCFKLCWSNGLSLIEHL